MKKAKKADPLAALDLVAYAMGDGERYGVRHDVVAVQDSVAYASDGHVLAWAPAHGIADGRYARVDGAWQSLDDKEADRCVPVKLLVETAARWRRPRAIVLDQPCELLRAALRARVVYIGADKRTAHSMRIIAEDGHIAKITAEHHLAHEDGISFEQSYPLRLDRNERAATCVDERFVRDALRGLGVTQSKASCAITLRFVLDGAAHGVTIGTVHDTLGCVILGIKDDIVDAHRERWAAAAAAA